MARYWTLGRRIGAGFAVTLLLTVAIGAVSVLALGEAVDSKDQVIQGYAARVADAERLHAAAATKSGEFRGYLVSRNETYLEGMREARAQFVSIADQMRREVGTAQQRNLIDEAIRAEASHQQGVDRLVQLARTGGAAATVDRTFDEDIGPTRAQLDRAIEAFASQENALLTAASKASTDTADTAAGLVLGLAVAAVLGGAMVAFLVTRGLSRQIGSSVGEVQSSAAELQTAASEQAAGAKQEATAMAEITTTMSELLATSRQISERAQQVTQIAEQTAAEASEGVVTVDRTHESVAGIRAQMDLIVDHMLELGERSQQIGAVLDIVSELAEQTNILAINATIEAAGAGEAGVRFAVVADEIRNLADRVGGSAKEIRALIDETRSAVNTTVMATETGAKTVEAGFRQFAVVADTFRKIAELVATTTDASREIELSTKQQTTAVEQVNVAVADVAQATRETEASSSQTRQTATQLAKVSKDLLRLVRPQTSA